MKLRATLLAAGFALLLCQSLFGAQFAGAASPTLDEMRTMLARQAASLRAGRPLRPRPPGKVVEPSLVSGKVVTPNVDVSRAPGQASIQFTIDPGNVGFEDGMAVITSPSGLHHLYATFYAPPYPPGAAKKPITLEFSGGLDGSALDLYSEPGDWTVSEFSIMSVDGDYIPYTAEQIAALFSSVTVNVINNGKSDITPPTFGQGALLTPVVSLSSAEPYFATRLAVADDVSGVAYVDVVAQMVDAPELFAASALQAPLRHGQVVSAAFLPSYTPTGIYTITEIDLCDYANNCKQDDSEEDIKKAFGTIKFRVTR